MIKKCVVNLGDRLFVGQTSQIQSFIDNTSNCATPRCQEKLVPVGMRVFGKGGAIEIPELPARGVLIEC